MDIHKGLTSGSLVQMLRRGLEAEKLWKPFPACVEGRPSSVGLDERNSVSRWLLAVNTAFGFNPETYVMGISLMDTFITSVKVQVKYLRCIATSCLFIAAKFHEEIEKVPTVDELVSGAGCTFSVTDLRRMELLVLDKLGWAPSRVNSLSFLQILHALLVRSNDSMATQAARSGETSAAGSVSLTHALFCLIQSGASCCWSPCTLALALLSVQATMWLPHGWLQPLLGLLSLTKKTREEVAACRREIMCSSIVLRMLKPEQLSPPPTRTPKRKAVDEELSDDVYECMKRMYAEESNNSTCRMSSVGQRREASTQPSSDRSNMVKI